MTLKAANVMEKYPGKMEKEKQLQEKPVKPDNGNANEPLGTHVKPVQNKVLMN